MTSSPVTPITLLKYIDGTGDIRLSLRAVAWTLCQSGDKLVTSLIKSGFNGCPCERAEFALGILEEGGWIIRGELEPVVGRSGLAFARAWPSVSIMEKAPVLVLVPWTSVDQRFRTHFGVSNVTRFWTRFGFSRAFPGVIGQDRSPRNPLILFGTQPGGGQLGQRDGWIVESTLINVDGGIKLPARRSDDGYDDDDDDERAGGRGGGRYPAQRGRRRARAARGRGP